MEKKKIFAYEKRYKDNFAIIIMYQWNKYFVGSSHGKNNNCVVILRQYKTLSGAEKFLLRWEHLDKDNSLGKPDISYGPEEYIKKGEYWR